MLGTKFLVIALGCATLAWSQVPAANSSKLDPLHFLAGAWSSEHGIEEYWMPPLRGLMVGINRSAEGDGTPFFEYLRIEERTDGVYYVASPKGSGSTAFRLTEVSDAHAVFENPDHDFPKKIAYTRAGDALEAKVGAITDGEWKGFTVRWTLAR